MGRIDLSPRPVTVGTFRTTPLMRRYIKQVLDSNRISYGPKSREFEDKFAHLHGCRYAVLSNSGTSSLQVALQAIKETHNIPDYSEVIVPATTFIATANIVKHCRLIPIFVDVRSDTYNMDMSLVREKITKDTCAIIPVHLFGQSADVAKLGNIICGLDRSDIHVIEDSCETMFVSHHDYPVGSLGDIGCFSTYAAHLIVTGVGGIATTNNPDYAAKMRSLVNHGLELKYLNVDDNYRPRPMPNRRFSFDTVGYSYRITELEAALGLAQLSTYREMLAIRRRNANHLTAGLKTINHYYDNPIQFPTIMEGNEHSWMLYPIVLRTIAKESVDKTPLVTWLNNHQIETRDMMPILNQPIYNWLDPRQFPVSDWLVKSGFYIGIHQNLEPEDIQYVIQTIEQFFQREDV